ncbi:uncharacterized protein BYT42DRAFT_572222 [Radiomyces spectabilis]|uniref:uncharacterized protein n=1 Tax=Radiomyces spectabilis TaxID=64574 RepID=UPI00221E6CE4|nr:uncharacterized protein BYT42DRAFT_572222 [Radiomyces spectabilis]KAI8377934.1 hypothetical protein BYT42DRAFT_572222 [Radiomyces spectabilis]
MQPHRHFNELDHWRTMSHRSQEAIPDPSKHPHGDASVAPSASKSTSNRHRRTASTSTSELRGTSDSRTTSKQPLFAIDTNRGWLDPHPIMVTPSQSHSSERKHAPSERKQAKDATADSRKGEYYFFARLVYMPTHRLVLV